jgi:NADH:quinone reductase (non-electrogenic)
MPAKRNVRRLLAIANVNATCGVWRILACTGGDYGGALGVTRLEPVNFSWTILTPVRHAASAGLARPKVGRQMRHLADAEAIRDFSNWTRSSRPIREDILEQGVTNHSSTGKQIVIAGAGYAGLHVALRLSASLDKKHTTTVRLVDQHDYHQFLTELPRVAAGTRGSADVRFPLQELVESGIEFVHTHVTGLDVEGHRLLTDASPLVYDWLVLAVGSRPNDFAIPGLAERAINLYSADDAERVRRSVIAALEAAAIEADPERQRRLATAVVGGGGATGVELAGELAETLPKLAPRFGLSAEVPGVILVEAGPTILAGSSPGLVRRADQILTELGVVVRSGARIAAATPAGFKLTSGEVIEGGVFVWAGGVKAADLVRGSGLPTGHNGRLKVDRFLRVVDHPQIFAAGDVASVVDPATGHVLPPLAQIALDEAETVARHLVAELAGDHLKPYEFHYKGQVVSVGPEIGVADVFSHVFGGRMAHLLKDAIEWEYRESVRHLHGWSVLEA